MSAVARVYRWEVTKLLAQKRTYLGLGAAILVPIIFVTVLVLQKGGPNDVPLGRSIRDTGLAVPFVVLFFMSIWGLPLITALVAGDIVASESSRSEDSPSVIPRKRSSRLSVSGTSEVKPMRAWPSATVRAATLSSSAEKWTSPLRSSTRSMPGWASRAVRARSGSCA